MNMRKNGCNNTKIRRLTPVTKRILCIGLSLIYASLFRLLFEITRTAPYPPSMAEHFGEMLEYPVAALALLTAAAYLAQRATDRKNT